MSKKERLKELEADIYVVSEYIRMSQSWATAKALKTLQRILEAWYEVEKRGVK